MNGLEREGEGRRESKQTREECGKARECKRGGGGGERARGGGGEREREEKK